MKTTISAEQIGDRFDADPELSLPHRPRFIPEMVAIRFSSNGLLFEGGKHIEVLAGESARTTVPRLLALMDGTRTTAEISSGFPDLTSDQARSVVALLFSRGLLEDGVPPAPPVGLSDVDALLGRWIDVTRVHRNRAAAWDRLNAHQVAILGPDRFVTPLEAQLRRSGLRDVTSVRDGQGSLQGRSLVIVIDDGEGTDASSQIAAALAQGVQVLHARIAMEAVEIGPLFVPGKSACYECFRLVTGPAPAGRIANDHDEQFWIDLLGLHAFQILSGISDVHLYNQTKRYQTGSDGPELNAQLFARLPGCKHCDLQAQPPLRRSGPEMRAWILHSSIGMPPREFLPPRAHQIHYAAANVLLTSTPPAPYYGAATIPIDATPLAASPPWSSKTKRQRLGTITMDDVAKVLTFSAGYQRSPQQSSRRIAPTGGGLNSPHLFLVAHRVAGLPSGAYHFDGARGLLERVREGVGDSLEAALHINERPACTIVGTADLQRVQGKYGGFAYRVVHLDAGIALGYIRLVASALGLVVDEHADFHDRALSPLIGFPLLDERYIPTFAASLSESDQKDDHDALPVGWALLKEVTRDSALPKAHRTAPVDWTMSASPDTAACPSFEQVLRERRSVRRFSDTPPNQEALVRIMQSAADLCEARVASGGPAVQVEPWLALRVASGGLRPGIYRADRSGSRELELVRSGCSPDLLLDSVLQKSLGSAPAVVFLCGNFSSAFAVRGSRGYRELLVQSGVAAAQILLSATSYKIASCPSGGLMESGFRALTGADGFSVAPTFAISLGHPESEV